MASEGEATVAVGPKSDRDRAKEPLARINLKPKLNAFDTKAIERIMWQNITSGLIPFRKAYIELVVNRIEVRQLWSR